MKYRLLGKTGFEVSWVSLGTWQVGGKWGSDFDHGNADRILNLAVDRGINFIDTAEMYIVRVFSFMDAAGSKPYLPFDLIDFLDTANDPWPLSNLVFYTAGF